METTNEYEKQARERKAIALIDTAMSAYDGEGFSAEDLGAFTDAQWELLADCAGVRPPSEVTKALVISSVRVRRADREKVSDEDLFVGL